MVEIKNLKKCYGERCVLNIPSLTLKKGETTVVVGPNGSGKSTLLKILSGVIKESEGTFTVAHGLYYLPQQSVAFSKTVRKNLLFSSNKKDKEKRADEVLTALELQKLADKNAKTLSGGERQRLALGRILMNDISLRLLDEPTSAADVESTLIIEKALKEYQKKMGFTILMSTHSPKQALKLSDRIIMLENGEIMEDGKPYEIIENPKTSFGKLFIDSWVIKKEEGSDKTC